MIEPDFSDFIQWHVDRCEACAGGGNYWECALFQEDMAEADALAEYQLEQDKENYDYQREEQG